MRFSDLLFVGMAIPCALAGAISTPITSPSTPAVNRPSPSSTPASISRPSPATAAQPHDDETADLATSPRTGNGITLCGPLGLNVGREVKLYADADRAAHVTHIETYFGATSGGPALVGLEVTWSHGERHSAGIRTVDAHSCDLKGQRVQQFRVWTNGAEVTGVYIKKEGGRDCVLGYGGVTPGVCEREQVGNGFIAGLEGRETATVFSSLGAAFYQ